MLELRGKYAEAKVFTDVVDQASVSQVIRPIYNFKAGEEA